VVRVPIDGWALQEAVEDQLIITFEHLFAAYFGFVDIKHSKYPHYGNGVISYETDNLADILGVEQFVLLDDPDSETEQCQFMLTDGFFNLALKEDISLFLSFTLPYENNILPKHPESRDAEVFINEFCYVQRDYGQWSFEQLEKLEWINRHLFRFKTVRNVLRGTGQEALRRYAYMREVLIEKGLIKVFRGEMREEDFESLSARLDLDIENFVD
jgi:hypothetical protein